MIKIFDLPIIGRFIQTFDEEVKKSGWQQAARCVVQRTNTKLSIHGINPGLKKILRHKGVILVVNHPSEAEILALIAALPPRQDVYLIANAMLVGICPSVDKHLIPVYIWNNRNTKDKRAFIWTLLHSLYPQKKYSPEQEHEKNILSIKIASEKVRSGAMVIIFPGKKYPSGHWFDGVGYLVSGVGGRKETYIIKVYSEGTSSWDYIRLLPFIGKILPAVKISFSTPSPIKRYILNDPKRITRKLEQEYDIWEDNIIKQDQSEL